MNQKELSERVVARLEREAARDPFRWVPAVGWTLRDGAPYGLGVELLGPEPGDAQLRKLASVIFRLFSAGTAEVASFRRPAAGATRLGEPLGPYDQTGYMLAGGGSKPLVAGGTSEYGVRLAREVR